MTMTTDEAGARLDVCTAGAVASSGDVEATRQQRASRHGKVQQQLLDGVLRWISTGAADVEVLGVSCILSEQLLSAAPADHGGSESGSGGDVEAAFKDSVCSVVQFVSSVAIN